MIGLMESFEAFIYIGAIVMVCILMMIINFCNLMKVQSVAAMLILMIYLAALSTVLVTGLTKGF